VTDANLLLGYLGDGAELGGELTLSAEAAEPALGKLGKELGLDALETALGVVRVANAEMGRALRVISVERGLDPREFALVAFGGAGGLHACALAEELGIPAVLVPRAGGVLSALGLAMSDVRRDYVRPLLGGEDATEAFEAMEKQAGEDMDASEAVARPQAETVELRRRADLRYRGQSFELTVEADDLDAVEERFAETHERRYGYRMESEEVELVNARVVATLPVEKPELPAEEADGDAEAGERRANFDGDWSEVPVYRAAGMGEGFEVKGPAIVEFAEATCVVRPGWSGAVDGTGTLVLERSE